MLRGLKCPRMVDVWAQWDGEPAGDRVAVLEEHVTACPECQAERGRLRWLSSALKESDPQALTGAEGRLRQRQALLERCRTSALAPPRPGGLAWLRSRLPMRTPAAGRDGAAAAGPPAARDLPTLEPAGTGDQAEAGTGSALNPPMAVGSPTRARRAGSGRRVAPAAIAAVALGALAGLWLTQGRPAWLGGGLLAGGSPGAAPVSTAGRHNLSGQVLDPDGRPVAGAKASWAVFATNGSCSELASQRTDGQGRFQFQNMPGWDYPPTPVIVVQATGWPITCQRVPDAGPLAINLVPATELRVPFLDPGGAPVSGLHVQVRALGGAGHQISLFLPIPSDLASQFSAITDKHGLCRFPNLPQSWRAQLAIADTRFAQISWDDLWVQLGETSITSAAPIGLQPGGSISGQVTFASTGQPAAGVEVYAEADKKTPEVRGGHAVADDTGHYVVRQLSAGTYDVRVIERGAIAGLWTASQRPGVAVAAGQEQRGVDLRLIKGAVITGRVTVAGTGKSVPGVLVAVFGPAGSLQNTATGSDGRYVLRVPAGDQYVYVQGPPSGYMMPGRHDDKLSVNDGDTATVDFHVVPAAPEPPLEGQVLRPDGHPAAGAEVILSDPGLNPSWGNVTTTDSAGRFRYAGFASRRMLLRARLKGMMTAQPVSATGSGEYTLLLQSNAQVSLSGELVDRAGNPAPGVRVALIESGPYGKNGNIVGRAGATLTDDQGHFTFAGLWPDFAYSVEADDDRYAHPPSTPLPVQPGERRFVGRIVVIPKAASGAK